MPEHSKTKSILPADWWFLRAPEIPHGETGEPIPMVNFAKAAAKICVQRVVSQLSGKSGRLLEVQLGEKQSTALTEGERNVLQARLNVTTKSQFNRMTRLSIDKWCPELAYQLAILRDTAEPGRSVLDWGAHVTWLAMNQYVVHDGQIPTDVLLYSACAIALCEKQFPVTDKQTLPQDYPEIALAVNKQPEMWKRDALRMCLLHLRSPFPILLPEQRRELQLLAMREHSEFFTRAEAHGTLVHDRLKLWNILS